MVTLTYPTKNSATLTYPDNMGVVEYLLTDALDYILVGASSDEVLVIRDNTTLTYPTKNSATLTYPTKH